MTQFTPTADIVLSGEILSCIRSNRIPRLQQILATDPVMLVRPLQTSVSPFVCETPLQACARLNRPAVFFWMLDAGASIEPTDVPDLALAAVGADSQVILDRLADDGHLKDTSQLSPALRLAAFTLNAAALTSLTRSDGPLPPLVHVMAGTSCIDTPFLPEPEQDRHRQRLKSCLEWAAITGFSDTDRDRDGRTAVDLITDPRTRESFADLWRTALAAAAARELRAAASGGQPATPRKM